MPTNTVILSIKFEINTGQAKTARFFELILVSFLENAFLSLGAEEAYEL